MPDKIPDYKVGRMVVLRALDYDKKDIARRLGVNRDTVRNHLYSVRQEAMDSENPADVVLGYAMVSQGTDAGDVGGVLRRALEEVE